MAVISVYFILCENSNISFSYIIESENVINLIKSWYILIRNNHENVQFLSTIIVLKKFNFFYYENESKLQRY